MANLLIIYSYKGKGGSKTGYTLRTRETVTPATLKNVEGMGHRVLKRDAVPDSLIDKTYDTKAMARESAEKAGFETLTQQAISYLTHKKKA